MAAPTGDGPVNAVYRTIERITGISGRLRGYSIRAVTDWVRLEIWYQATGIRPHAFSVRPVWVILKCLTPNGLRPIGFVS